jgi:hypothetical protein
MAAVDAYCQAHSDIRRLTLQHDDLQARPTAETHVRALADARIDTLTQ